MSAAPALPSAMDVEASNPSEEVEDEVDDEVPLLLPEWHSKPTDTMARLMTRDPVRKPVVRATKSFKENRSSNFEALLAQYVGQLPDEPCGHCAKGSGPWTVCVVVPGLLQGSCANCHNMSEGQRCQYRIPAAEPTPTRQSAGKANGPPTDMNRRAKARHRRAQGSGQGSSSSPEPVAFVADNRKRRRLLTGGCIRLLLRGVTRSGGG